MADDLIFYSNLTVRLHKRGRTWEDNTYFLQGVVVKGTDGQIKKDKKVLRRCAVMIFGKTKGHKFELDRIRIEEIQNLRELGLGYMRQNEADLTSK